jgi:hypothetical protein
MTIDECDTTGEDQVRDAAHRARVWRPAVATRRYFRPLIGASVVLFVALVLGITTATAERQDVETPDGQLVGPPAPPAADEMTSEQLLTARPPALQGPLSTASCQRRAAAVQGDAFTTTTGAVGACTVRYSSADGLVTEIGDGVESVTMVDNECSDLIHRSGLSMSFRSEGGAVVRGFGIGPTSDGDVAHFAAAAGYEMAEMDLGDGTSTYVLVGPAVSGMPDGRFVEALALVVYEHATVDDEDVAVCTVAEFVEE